MSQEKEDKMQQDKMQEDTSLLDEPQHFRAPIFQGAEGLGTKHSFHRPFRLKASLCHQTLVYSAALISIAL
jgi:hypothetical protein